MIVVSDTSAISSLLDIGWVELLIKLYGSVVVPEAVALELRRTHSLLPEFIRVLAVPDRSLVRRLQAELDSGEAEAIALMLEGRGEILLMDERRGRRVAAREGVPVIGLLGVLAEAKRNGLIERLGDLLTQLETRAGFRVSQQLKRRVLDQARESPP
jgi:uncharacterized protein